ncbi:CPCC family cysteine-rich protein [Acinetobacter nosocomialis]|uniref:CPCC family cysteine-rich protein n=1 Tax=Acinetobacter nosocomialis TaxID=106654 RepID=UPI00244CE65D|nr:CPCC family cysteine-rich protein [Acinetobacter nosocomialis]MDH2634130.1 CPCC family cysteine-rich protein [Acinetobacter nosocomialis]
MSYACPCCGYLTFDELPYGSFDICAVCFWEDDNVQNKDPDYMGGANGISLNMAKKNFQLFGAMKKEFIPYTRKPLEEEIP